MSDVLTLSEQDTKLHKASHNEYAGPCPDTSCRCQTDGFRVRHNGKQWVFMCRGCYDSGEYLAEKGRKRGWGDAVDYLRHYRHMTYGQAALAIGAPVQSSSPNPSVAPMIDQDQIHAAMQLHIARLWGDDTTALAYARRRGLLDHVIQQAQLGYSLKDGIPRLLIPSINDHTYVAIYRRNLLPDVPHNERWKDTSGFSKTSLYLADCLKRRKPTVLCEDAFSALSVLQEAGDFVNVVATGGASGCRLPSCLVQLAVQPLVFVALDADEDGDKYATWWLRRLSNAVRLRPLLKDINEMLIDGWDIRDWLQAKLEEMGQPDTTLRCCVCGMSAEEADDFYYDANGEPFCNLHYQPELIASIPSPSMEPIYSEQELLQTFVARVTSVVGPDADISEPFKSSPSDYIARRKAAIDALAQQKKEEEHMTPARYWQAVTEKLTKQGYYEMVARDTALLQQRVDRYKAVWLQPEGKEQDAVSTMSSA